MVTCSRGCGAEGPAADDADAAEGGGSAGGDVVPVTVGVEAHATHHVAPWQHAVYAGTWYTLALLGVAMTRKRFVGSRWRR